MAPDGNILRHEIAELTNPNAYAQLPAGFRRPWPDDSFQGFLRQIRENSNAIYCPVFKQFVTTLPDIIAKLEALQHPNLPKAQ